MKPFNIIMCNIIVIYYGGMLLDVDIAIIKKCKKNDKASLVHLFHQYEKYLYHLCYSYTQNEQDALDLVQEVYIKVFNNLSKFDESYPFHPWIRRIAVNTCLNFKRDKRSNVISLNYEIEEDLTLGDKIASDEDIENDIVNLDIKEILMKHVKELPEQYRLIIALRYYEDLSYNEIASLLDKPLGTVKTDLYRAKAMLKRKLEGTLEVG